MYTFRDRLLATLRAAEPVLRVPGVVVGSEVPNLLEPGAAATLVVSRDVDLAVPVDAHQAVKERLEQIVGLVPSTEEPSVWAPHADRGDLIELNFLGLDPSIVDPMDSYEKPDDRLPLMVFGPRPGSGSRRVRHRARMTLVPRRAGAPRGSEPSRT